MGAFQINGMLCVIRSWTRNGIQSVCLYPLIPGFSCSKNCCWRRKFGVLSTKQSPSEKVWEITAGWATSERLWIFPNPLTFPHQWNLGMTFFTVLFQWKIISNEYSLQSQENPVIYNIWMEEYKKLDDKDGIMLLRFPSQQMAGINVIKAARQLCCVHPALHSRSHGYLLSLLQGAAELWRGGAAFLGVTTHKYMKSRQTLWNSPPVWNSLCAAAIDRAHRCAALRVVSVSLISTVSLMSAFKQMARLINPSSLSIHFSSPFVSCPHLIQSISFPILSSFPANL